MTDISNNSEKHIPLSLLEKIKSGNQNECKLSDIFTTKTSETITAYGPLDDLFLEIIVTFRKYGVLIEAPYCKQSLKDYGNDTDGFHIGYSSTKFKAPRNYKALDSISKIKKRTLKHLSKEEIAKINNRAYQLSVHSWLQRLKYLRNKTSKLEAKKLHKIAESAIELLKYINVGKTAYNTGAKYVGLEFYKWAKVGFEEIKKELSIIETRADIAKRSKVTPDIEKKIKKHIQNILKDNNTTFTKDAVPSAAKIFRLSPKTINTYCPKSGLRIPKKVKRSKK